MPQNTKLFEIPIFAGVDLTTDPDKVSPAFATVATNFVPYRTYGQAVASKGRTSGIIVGSFSSALTNFSLFLSSSGLAAIGFTSTGVLQVVILGSSPSSVSLPSGVTLTAGLKIRTETYGGYLFITDGADQPLKISQSSTGTATRWGINPSTVAPTAASGGAGVLNGVYYYCYTYYNSVSRQESSHSLISGALTLSNNSATVTPTASTDPQVTNINIYRLGGTLSTWIQVGQATNVSSAFTDNTADSAVTGQNLVLHRDPPANFVDVCVHKERVWGLGYNQAYAYSYTNQNTYTSIPAQPSDLWYSRYGEPWSFDCVNNVLPMGRNSYGDIGVGMASLGSVLVVHKRYSTWLVFGDSEQDFRQIPALTNIGAYSRETIAAGYGVDFWLSPDGNIWQFDGANAPINISEGSPEKGGIQAALNAANGNFASWQFAIFERVLYVNTGSTTYGYYIKSGTWFVLGWGTNWMTSIPQYPYIAGISPSGNSLDGWFVNEGDSYATSSSPYTQTWQTGITDGGKETARATYRFCIIKMPPGDPNNTLKVTFIIDGNSIGIPVTLNPRTASSANQGVGGLYYRLSLPSNCAGYSCSVQLTATQASTTPMRITSLSLYGSNDSDFAPQNSGILGGGS